MNPKEIVRDGYDAMAEQYLASKDPQDELVIGALEELAGRLPAGLRVLDLGCGAGVPASKWLAERFAVTGVDISERQLELARREAPGAKFVLGDMGEVDFPPGSFEAVTAFYSIIHLPREEQAGLLRRIHSWLAPGGLFLANWATGEWEGREENWENWGAAMWWSHYDAATNLALIERAGFQIESAQQRTSHGETWLWVLAQASGAPAA